MATPVNVPLQVGNWELLTAENVTAEIRIQNWSQSATAEVQATNGATEPASNAGALRIPPGATPVGTLAEWFPGQTVTRLYGRAVDGPVTLSVVW